MPRISGIDSSGSLEEGVANLRFGKKPLYINNFEFCLHNKVKVPVMEQFSGVTDFSFHLSI